MKLLSKTITSRSIRIGIGILLVLLGCLATYSQFRGRGNFNPRRNFAPIYPPEQNLPRPPFGDTEFTFARMIYTGMMPLGYGKHWNTDWPKSDRQFILGVQRLTNIRIADEGVIVELTDTDLFQYPFLYSVESGHWNLTDSEITGLREYLKRGGFLFCDDFWGSREWENFEQNISRVLPEARIADIPMDHDVFHCYYDISELVQTPFVDQAMYSTQTSEQDGIIPHCKGIFDEKDRLMGIINWNTDLGDSWEWADLPDFPARFSTYAYKIGINAIVYAMSH